MRGQVSVELGDGARLHPGAGLEDGSSVHIQPRSDPATNQIAEDLPAPDSVDEPGPLPCVRGPDGGGEPEITARRNAVKRKVGSSPRSSAPVCGFSPHGRKIPGPPGG